MALTMGSTLLVGWLNVMKRLGRGYTKLAPALRSKAAQLLREAREAVPVWIMPIARVVEQFDPGHTRFDVIIIDEASQADVLGLAALYMGEKVVVVGDHEQVSPEGVGQELDSTIELIAKFLGDIPNNTLYDGRRSIYDIAREAFGGTIMLLEHFRCVPEIIQFSNLLSYGGRIKPLRESKNASLKPHVVPYRVVGAYLEKKVNPKEAEELVSLLTAAIEHPAYEGKTFGVISLVGDDQARYIDGLLRKKLSESVYKDCQILCGTAAQFQGDERDVVFLSLVDVPGAGPLAMREDERFRQRFNVAASRARDQLWVVYSLDPSQDLKAGDLRRRLIEYALDPEAGLRAMMREGARTQSPFEKEVLERLINAGYRVYAQWPVGYYWIDLVVEGAGKRIAIECDGDRWHPLEKLKEDLERQEVLERLGWNFIRIRGTQFYRDPDGTMKWVFEELRNNGLVPEGYLDSFAEPRQREGNELLDALIRRAAELRAEWEESAKDPEKTYDDDVEHSGAQDKLQAKIHLVVKENSAGISPEIIHDATRGLLEKKNEGIKLSDGLAEARKPEQASDFLTPIQRSKYTKSRRLREQQNKSGSGISNKKAGGKALENGGFDFEDGKGSLRPSDVPLQLTVDSAVSAVPKSPEGDFELLVQRLSFDSMLPSDWFQLARWAKENGFFESWERKLAYTMGRYLSNGWTLSSRQEAQAKRILGLAEKLGFHPNSNG